MLISVFWGDCFCTVACIEIKVHEWVDSYRKFHKKMMCLDFPFWNTTGDIIFVYFLHFVDLDYHLLLIVIQNISSVVLFRSIQMIFDWRFAMIYIQNANPTFSNILVKYVHTTGNNSCLICFVILNLHLYVFYI